jgi:serine/threonine-protein kinase
MEYVEGEPITAHADRLRLSIDERLLLFEEVCDAVQYAQRHLVVHRDLKPSNILVTAEGRVKLLDFGIAKLIGDADDGDAAPLTQRGGMLMTPGYAAPEQIEGRPVTTATDVYALGVILYELLAGAHPHGARRTPALLVRAVLETDARALTDSVAAAPRAAVEASVEPATDVCALRRTSPRALRRRLRGDLENIVARALERDPARRYPTAEALLDDLRRHRSNLPVSAHRPAWSYRAAKFVARHRVPVAAAALLVLAIGAGVAGIVWQSRETARAASRATAVKEFLVELFESSDPDAAPGRELSARDVLARGAERVTREMGGEPEVQAELLRTIGGIQTELGEYAAARPLLDSALVIAERTFGADSPEAVECLTSLASVAYWSSDPAEAESLFRRAEAIERGRRNPSDIRLATIASGLAATLNRLGRTSEAEPLYREAIERDRRARGEDHPAVLSDLGNLAVFLEDSGRFAEAIEAHQQVLDRRRRVLPPGHSEIALSLHNLGHAFFRDGRYAAADSTLRDAVAMRRALYDGPHPLLVGSLTTLAQVRTNVADYAGAESLLAEAREMASHVFGADHQEIGRLINESAILAYQADDLATAAARFRASIAVFERSLPADHPTLATLRSNLAKVDQQRGAYEAALGTYEEVLALRRDKLGGDHPQVAASLNDVGTTLRLMGRPLDAAARHREALALQARSLGSDHPSLDTSMHLLATALRDARAFAESESLYRAAIARCEAHPDSPTAASLVCAAFGRMLLEAGRPREALPLLERAEAEERARSGEGGANEAIAAATRGACLARLGRRDAGRELLARSHATLLRVRGADHPETRRAAALLAEAGG